ncbi:hypothetical protein HK098_001854 [Nowakowskiella sp. JEL0407]|nr:hypothetical protein HK098_001854 [Nowakowskiella sp. JEL0407]
MALNISKLSQCTSTKEFYTEISNIANDLLNNRLLKISIDGKFHFYRLTEVEAYLNTSDFSHKDPFCHCKEEQRENTQWYFHRQGNAMDSYRGGTRKGLDITFGSPVTITNMIPNDTEPPLQVITTKQFHGGFLIRSIQPSSGRMIEGPCLVVDEILSKFGKDSIKELVSGPLNGSIDATKGPLKLELINNVSVDNVKDTLDPVGFLSDTRSVYTGPRVGLAIAKTYQDVEQRLSFIALHYRYFVFPKLQKKGYTQLLTGLLVNSYLDGAEESPEWDVDKCLKKTGEIIGLTGAKKNKISSFITEFASGVSFGTEMKSKHVKETVDDVSEEHEGNDHGKKRKGDRMESFAKKKSKGENVLTYSKQVADLSLQKDVTKFFGAVFGWLNY